MKRGAKAERTGRLDQAAFRRTIAPTAGRARRNQPFARRRPQREVQKPRYDQGSPLYQEGICKGSIDESCVF
jgi:hypothetical protein